MEIIAYQPDQLSVLTELYNGLTRTVPHCYPVQPEELAGAFAGECAYGASPDCMTGETIFVAVDPEPIGFVHIGEGMIKREETPKPQGTIRFLAYPRGRRDAGQALLAHAETWFRTCGLDSVFAYRQSCRYPFYHFAHAYLSNHLEHIQSLLLFNGYEEYGGEVFLDWPDMEPRPPRDVPGLEISLDIQHKPGKGRLPDLTLKAHHRGQEVGECVSLSASVFSNRDVVQDWIFTQWLGITDAFQGRGLGRYLLGCALVEARKIGYRHAAISTAMNNHRALLFYANFGYHAVDWTRLFRRTLV